MVKRACLNNQRGFTMVVVFLLLLLLLSLGSATLLYGVLDTKSTTHYQTGNQALFAAESGVFHALSAMNGVGVIDFQKDIADRWGTLYGAALRSIPGYPNASYQVAIAASATNPATGGTITTTGFAPLQAQRMLRIRVTRNTNIMGSQGAVYGASDDVDPQFTGNSFFIDGNDHDLNMNPTSNPARPGISTRNDGATSAMVNALNNQQLDNVQGLGFSTNPLTPSVMTTGGPAVSDINRMIADLLLKPHVNWTSNHISGGDVLGTVDNPQITYLTQDDVSVANGHAQGAGILIANGSLRIAGTFDFVGWILVRGETTIDNHPNNEGTYEMGSGNILGSLWTGDFNIKIGGNANVFYSDAAMQLAGTTGGGGSVPTPMMVSLWEEL